MTKRIDQLPAVLTSYAYRKEYFPELEAMIPTVREHHPNWLIISGRGPVVGFEMPTLHVESPVGRYHWSLPVSLNLEGTREASERDWARIALMKPWWIAEVWRHLGKLNRLPEKRLIWLDADARLNGPLDIALDPGAEAIAGPWWGPEEIPANERHICGGLLLFQGRAGGIVDSIIHQWAQQCISYITNLPPAPPPEQRDKARADDQRVLTDLLETNSSSHPLWLKLDYDKYCGVADVRSGAPASGALVDQWMMNEKMRLPEDRDRNWPPAEVDRRRHSKNATR